jgi:hypothetical protein
VAAFREAVVGGSQRRGGDSAAGDGTIRLDSTPTVPGQLRWATFRGANYNRFVSRTVFLPRMNRRLAGFAASAWDDRLFPRKTDFTD